MLMRGEIKQFQMLPIPLDNAGLVKAGGNQQGMYEMEGNSLIAMTIFLDKEFNQLVSVAGAQANLYVRFNHVDAPWLPIGIPLSATSRVPTSYTLTIGRFWLYNVNPAAGQFIYLMLTRGVCMYSSGNLGPAILGAYQTPTWQALK